MSSFGNAPSRQKSIDVEFNLLRTWTAARLDLHRRLAQRAALGFAVVLAGSVLLPILSAERGAAAMRAASATSAMRAADRDASAKESRASQVQSAVERDAEILSSANRTNGLLGGLATVLNAAPEALVIRALQFDVAGGILTVKIHAEAPDGETARTFARRLGDAPGIANAKASSIIQNGRSGGVTFDVTTTGTAMNTPSHGAGGTP